MFYWKSPFCFLAGTLNVSCFMEIFDWIIQYWFISLFSSAIEESICFLKKTIFSKKSRQCCETRGLINKKQCFSFFLLFLIKKKRIEVLLTLLLLLLVLSLLFVLLPAIVKVTLPPLLTHNISVILRTSWSRYFSKATKGKTCFKH